MYYFEESGLPEVQLSITQGDEECQDDDRVQHHHQHRGDSNIKREILKKNRGTNTRFINSNEETK